MRKELINQVSDKEPTIEQSWLDLERMARVKLTSEDEAYPIESALAPTNGAAGWKAAQPGEQTIRLVFDEPQKVKRIELVFHEREQERTQEFLLCWLPKDKRTLHEIVRQQYNFSPPHTTEESEAYTVDLDEVGAIELRIVPDISGRNAYASLAQLRIS